MPGHEHVEHIVRESRLPLYQQLYEILRGKIKRGEWEPGRLVPPEWELTGLFGLSRVTVRQALDALAREGLISRQRGRGTYVAQPTLEKGLTHIVSFTQDMRERGMEPATQVLAQGLVAAPPEVAERLQIDADCELARLERLRLANDEPMALEESYLVHRYCPGVLRGDYSTTPLRDALEREHGIRLVRARQVIRAVPADKRQARLLKVRFKAPILCIERVSYSQQQVPVEFLRIYYRGDRYTLYNELQG